MIETKKFYLYYLAESGTIKAISPSAIDEFQSLPVTMLPFDIAFKFLSGEYDTHNWFVASCSTETNAVLTQDQFDFTLITDDQLTLIPRVDYMVNVKSAIDVTIIPKEKTIKVSVPTIDFKLNTEGKEDMVFYVTKRNDPMEVYLEFSVNTTELFDKGFVDVPFETTHKDFSVYTRKMFRFYQMSVQHTRKKMMVQSSHIRFNKLVDFRYTVKAEKADSGINVIHNINKGTLVLRISGDTDHIPTYLEEVMLFLTKPRDPTVLIDAVSYNIQRLIEDETVTISLPDNIGDNFGISGYPYMEQLTYTRK